MASLAQIQTISRTMDDLLGGKVIAHIDIPYLKCANAESHTFNKRTCGAAILGVYCREGWIILKLSNAHSILIHLGWNANLLFHEDGGDISKRFDVKLDFADHSAFTLKYWMGGKFYLAEDNALPAGLRAREYMRQIFEQRLPCQGEAAAKSKQG